MPPPPPSPFPSSLSALLPTLLSLPVSAPLKSSLQSLTTSPSPESQIQTGSNLPPPPLSLPLSLLPLHLPSWHFSHPQLSLSYLPSLLSSLPNSSAHLQTLLSLLSSLSSSPSPLVKEALSSSLPILLPLLHAHLPVSLPTIVTLSATFPTAFLSHYALFMPPSPSLTCLFCTPSPQARAQAVTAVTNTLSSAKHLLRTTRTTRAPSRPHAFTSTGTRVIEAGRLLHAIVARAVLEERDGIVLAKHAKLAALILACLPYPLVAAEHVARLVTALRKRVRGDLEVDLTSWGGLAGALAVGVGKSGGVLDVPRICGEIVGVLKYGKGVPTVELLGVLRSVVGIEGGLFWEIWEGIGDYLVGGLKGGLGKGVILWFLRVIESFLGGVGKGGGSLWKDLGLGWLLYERVLKVAVAGEGERVQAVSLGCMESLLRICEGVGEIDGEEGRTGKDVVLVGRVEEVVALLEEFALADRGNAVRIAAVRALGSTPVRYVGKGVTLSALCCLDHVLREGGDELSLTGKALGVVANYMEKVLTLDMKVGSDMVVLFQAIAVFAIDLLRENAVDGLESSAATRTNVESSRIAAMNVISCALRHREKLNIWCNGEGLAQDQIDALVEVLKNNDSVNTKCICCKAIGHILRTRVGNDGDDDLRCWDADLMKGLEYALEKGGAVRLQSTAVQVINEVTSVHSRGNADIVHYIGLCARAFQNTVRMCTSEHEQSKKNEKRDLLSLQDFLSEFIYGLLLNANEQVLDTLTRCEADAGRDVCQLGGTLIDAVFLHLSIPRHLAEHMSKASTHVPISNSERNSQLLLESLTAESRETVYKALCFKAGNGNATLKGEMVNRRVCKTNEDKSKCF